MIVGAAVCPGAPFLIDGTADAIADRLQPVVAACVAAISRLPAADELILISAGQRAVNGGSAGIPEPSWRLRPPGTVVSVAALRRSDQPERRPIRLSSGDHVEPAGPGGGTPGTTGALSTDTLSSDSGTISVGTMVGASLLADRPLPPTMAVEVFGDPAAVAAMLANRTTSAALVSILVIADGSACHGDDAPGRPDERASAFDAALAGALGAGEPAALVAAAGQRAMAGELLATVDPLTVLGLITAPAPPTTAELLYSGAPLGVGYLVASWTWSAVSCRSD